MQTQPVDFLPPSAETPQVHLPDTGTLFLKRAERFDAVAHDHSLGEWLNFLAHLSRAQHAALQKMSPPPLPENATIARAAEHGMPPLSVASLPRPPVWRDILREIASDMTALAPANTRNALKALLAADNEEIEALGDQLLAGVLEQADMVRLPFVAAALQVAFTSMASQLDADKLPLMESHAVCPVCGSLPAVSVIRSNAASPSLRYGHCTLCNTEWHIPRAVCVDCGSDEKLALHEIEGSDGTARAESCECCHSYLKLISQGKHPHIDPIADDLSSIALDMLVDEAGLARSGPNLLLLGAGAQPQPA